MTDARLRELLSATTTGRAALAELDAKAKAAKLDTDNGMGQAKAEARAEHLTRMKSDLEGVGLTFAANSQSSVDYLLSLTGVGRAALAAKQSQ